MNTYEITLKHDGGNVTFRVSATDCHAAIRQVCDAEKAPVSAVSWWRVIPTKRQIAKTKNLLRGL